MAQPSLSPSRRRARSDARPVAPAADVPRDATRRRALPQLAALAMLASAVPQARSQEAKSDIPGERRLDATVSSVELPQLELTRDESGQLLLSFQARLRLGSAVMDALRRGIPVHFLAQARLIRPRWWWRDAQVVVVQRSWRLAYLPLTSNWRVSSTGGLAQTVPTLAEALAWVSRAVDWPVAELSQLTPQARHVLNFSYRLDASQLPGPMQIGLTDQADWDLAVERTLPVDPP